MEASDNTVQKEPLENFLHFFKKRVKKVSSDNESSFSLSWVWKCDVTQFFKRLKAKRKTSTKHLLFSCFLQEICLYPNIWYDGYRHFLPFSQMFHSCHSQVLTPCFYIQPQLPRLFNNFLLLFPVSRFQFTCMILEITKWLQDLVPQDRKYMCMKVCTVNYTLNEVLANSSLSLYAMWQ